MIEVPLATSFDHKMADPRFTARVQWSAVVSEPAQVPVGGCIPVTIAEPCLSRPHNRQGYIKLGANHPGYGVWRAEMAMNNMPDEWLTPFSSYPGGSIEPYDTEKNQVFLITQNFGMPSSDLTRHVRVRRVS